MKNHKARAFKYSSRTRNRELCERIRAEQRHLYNECYSSYRDGIENGIERDPRRFFDFANYKRKTVGYLSLMRYDLVDDCPADICELFANLFLRVSIMLLLVTQILHDDASGSIDGYGFSGNRLCMSNL
jgi:hypothetical protein